MAHPSLGMELVGYFDDRSAERVGKLEHAPLLGKLADLASYCSQKYVDRIYIALPMAQQQRVVNFLDALKDTTASIYFIPDVYLFDLMHARVSEVNGIPVLGICESPLCGMNGFVKRCFDMVVSSLVLVLIFPLMLLIAIGVKLSSPGPVLFKQRRYGMDGREILIYKFRSMRWNPAPAAGTLQQTSRDDPRFTKLGRFLRATSLDELPQLFNVLKGDMSLVGPRPHAVNMRTEDRLGHEITDRYAHRHRVKPGMTVADLFSAGGYYTELLAGETGKTVLGIGGLLLLGLCVTGLVLWWPRNGKISQGFTVRWSARRKRLNFDLHRVSGFYASLLLLLTASTGAAFVFNKTATGFIDTVTASAPRAAPPRALPSPKGTPARALDSLLQQADRVLPAPTTWVSLPQSPQAPLVVRKKLPQETHPNGRNFVYLNQYTGKVVQIEHALSAPFGTRVFNTFYPLHIGAIGGTPTRILQVVAGLAPTLLLVTGFVMWKSRKKGNY